MKKYEGRVIVWIVLMVTMYFLLGIMLGIDLVSAGGSSDYCNDTDEQNFFNKGITCFNTISGNVCLTDVCSFYLLPDNSTEYIVTEFYCENNTMQNKNNICINGCFNGACIKEIVCPVPETCPSCNCGGSSCSSKVIYKNNTITEYKYLTSNYTPICEETICNNSTAYIDKLIEVSKPFYKSFWFYSTILFLIILIIGIFWDR